jgi:uncharacterized membrane protein YkvA (DUF1232 family)
VVDTGTIVAIVGGLLALWLVVLALLWILRPRDVAARELLRLVPDLLRLLRSIVADRSAPWDVRVILVLLVAWILSPIDLIPEFIPVLGPLDDIVVAVIAMRYTRRRMGLESLRSRWAGTDEGFELVARVLGGQ